MQAYQLRDRKKTRFSPKQKRSSTKIPGDLDSTATDTTTKVNKPPPIDLSEGAKMSETAEPEIKTTDEMIKDLWLDMKAVKQEVKGVNASLNSVKDDIQSNYEDLIEKIENHRKAGEDLEARVDLAHDRIATLENCFMDLYHENQMLKNKQKACNIIIRGVPEQDKEKMHETMGELFGAIGGNANYLLTDGAARVGKYTKHQSKQLPVGAAGGTTAGRQNEPRPIRVFCKSLLLKGEIFRGVDKIKAVPKFANIRLANDLNDDELMAYKEIQLIHTAAQKIPNVASKMKGNRIEIDGKTYDRKNFHELPHGITLENASTILTNDGLAFASHCSPYSNLYPVKIEDDEFSYNCAEQYIMYNRAKSGGDEVVAAKILSEENPYTIMNLGKSVKNNQEWKKMEKTVVKKAVYMKFSQNKKLHEKIMKVKADRFYECTLHPVHGAGFTLKTAEKDTAAVKPTHQNYMGLVLHDYKAEALAQNT